MPRRPSEIEISLDTMPQMPTGDCVRRDVTAARREEILVLLLADVDPAAAAADQHPAAGSGRRAARHRATPRARPRRRTAPRANSASGSARPSDSSSPSSATARFNRYRWTAAADAARIGRRVELGDRARAADAAADVSPEAIASGAERRDDADPADDDARHAVDRHGVTIIPAVRTDRRRYLRALRDLLALGGLLFFVDSLLYFVYRYVVVFGREHASARSAIARSPSDVVLFSRLRAAPQHCSLATCSVS